MKGKNCVRKCRCNFKKLKLIAALSCAFALAGLYFEGHHTIKNHMKNLVEISLLRARQNSSTTSTHILKHKLNNSLEAFSNSQQLKLQQQSTNTSSYFIQHAAKLRAEAFQMLQQEKEKENKKPGIHFYTYATDNLADTRERIRIEAACTGWFNTVTALGPDYLLKSFRMEFADILQQRQGGGFWLWKFPILEMMLEHMPHGDYAVYADAGCQINNENPESNGQRFQEWINLIQDQDTKDILKFRLTTVEEEYTTERIFEAFGVAPNDTDVRQSNQLVGGVFVVRNGPHIRNLVATLYEVLAMDPYIVTNQYNQETIRHYEAIGRPGTFKDNRHDQSVQSVLMKKTDTAIIIPDETFPPDLSSRSPILAGRVKRVPEDKMLEMQQWVASQCSGPNPWHQQNYCSKDPLGDKVVLDRIHIHPPVNSTSPKVLCFVPILSTHKGKAQELLNTWGKRCDKLVFASNATDRELGAFKVEIANNDWAHLWQKERETMRHVWKIYGQDYDWFLKADLDTYVIMENLKAYLASEEIQSKQNESMILGHRLSIPEDLSRRHFRCHNKSLEQEFLKKSNNTIRFTSGGAGFVMNKKYLGTFHESMDQYFCLSDEIEMTQPEDVALNFCMGNLGISPYNTRDELGRERFHMFSPHRVYNIKDKNKGRLHRDIGGLRGGNDCCSTATISFHELKQDGALHNLERMLYHCRKL